MTQIELGTVTDQSDAAWASFSSQQQSVATYDANGRAVKQEAKAGGTTYAVAQTNYDALGRVNCTVQRMDPAQWASQTDACVPQTSNVTTGPDRVSKAIYNAASEVTQVQAAVGTTDQANEASSTYNTNGTLAMLTDAENNRTTYEYDGFDRTAKVRFPNGTQGSLTSSTTDYEQFTYDVRSNITQRRLRDGHLRSGRACPGVERPGHRPPNCTTGGPRHTLDRPDNDGLTRGDEGDPVTVIGLPDGEADRLARLALTEDLSLGADVTTVATVAEDATDVGEIVARADGVLCGLDIARAVFAAVDPDLDFRTRVHDDRPG